MKLYIGALISLVVLFFVSTTSNAKTLIDSIDEIIKKSWPNATITEENNIYIVEVPVEEVCVSFTIDDKPLEEYSLDYINSLSDSSYESGEEKWEDIVKSLVGLNTSIYQKMKECGIEDAVSVFLLEDSNMDGDRRDTYVCIVDGTIIMNSNLKTVIQAVAGRKSGDNITSVDLNASEEEETNITLSPENIEVALGYYGAIVDSEGKISVKGEDAQLFQNLNDLFGEKGHFTYGVDSKMVTGICWVFQNPISVESEKAIVDGLKTIYGSSYTKIDYKTFIKYVWEPDMRIEFEFSRENVSRIYWSNCNKINQATTASVNDSNSMPSDDNSNMVSDHSTSSLTHKCQAPGCEKEGTRSFEGFTGEDEWYCDEHYQEMMGIINGMEQDVGDGTYSSHTCDVEGCTREGTNPITGITGETEYYCTDHYYEMKEMMDSLFG